MVSDNLDYTEKDFRISDFSYFFPYVILSGAKNLGDIRMGRKNSFYKHLLKSQKIANIAYC